MDIVGGAVSSLCRACDDICLSGDAGQRVNLLFDRDTDALAISAPYPGGCLQIRTKRSGSLSVRIPPWAAGTELAVNGVSRPLTLENGYLVLEDLPVDAVVTLRMPLSKHEVLLKHWTREIRTQHQGDEVIAMDNFGADLTFFDPIAVD